MAASRQRKQQANVIVYASDRDRHHRVLARDPAQVSMQSIPHLFPDCRLSSAGAEHQVNQAKYVTMRHENQPSLTGLVHPRFATQHCVLGYYQAVPAGLTLQTAVAARGLERNAHRSNGCGCDPAMIQPSRKSLENLETPGTGFTGCGKTEFLEGDGLQAVRK